MKKFVGFVSRKALDELNQKLDYVCELAEETKNIMSDIEASLNNAVVVAEDQNATVKEIETVTGNIPREAPAEG